MSLRLFVPAESNPLLDVLLARGVNGESPTKRKRSEPTSPPRRKGKARARPRKDPKQAVDVTLATVEERKPKAQAAKRQPKAKITKAGTNSSARSHETQDDTPVAGMSLQFNFDSLTNF